VRSRFPSRSPGLGGIAPKPPEGGTPNQCFNQAPNKKRKASLRMPFRLQLVSCVNLFDSVVPSPERNMSTCRPGQRVGE
jgi:hypothetical protein